MKVSFGMTPNPLYHINQLEKKTEPQYINAKSVNNILDDLKVRLMMEVNYAQEDIARQTSNESINKIPADILRALAGIGTPKCPTPTETPVPKQPE